MRNWSFYMGKYGEVGKWVAGKVFWFVDGGERFLTLIY